MKQWQGKWGAGKRMVALGLLCTSVAIGVNAEFSTGRRARRRGNHDGRG